MENGIVSRIKAVIRESGIQDHTTDSIVQPLLNLWKRLWVANNTLSLNGVWEKLDTEYRQWSCNREIEELINLLLLRMPGKSDSESHHLPGSEPYLGINIHLDTPVKILHTILLGVVKYFWGQSIFIMDKANNMGQA